MGQGLEGVMALLVQRTSKRHHCWDCVPAVISGTQEVL